MSKSPLNSLRLSANAVFTAAEKLGLSPVKLTNWGLLEISVDDTKHYLFTSKTILNTQLAAYLSANKHATRTIFAEHGLPNIPFSIPKDLTEAKAFFTKYHPIVAKPTMGQRAQGIKLIKNREELSALNFKGLILEKYIWGAELRYLVLDGKVIAVEQKKYDGELYTPQNSSRISYPESEWDPELASLAVKAAQLLGLGFVAVDFKINENKKPLILEVNSAPAIWRFEQPDEGPAIPVAELLLQATLKKIRANE